MLWPWWLVEKAACWGEQRSFILSFSVVHFSFSPAQMSVLRTFGPILTPCYFVSLVLSGLSCWSFSGWVDHCICLPDVPRLPRCGNLADFKETTRRSELICSCGLSCSLSFSSTLLAFRVLSSFVVSCVVGSPFQCLVFFFCFVSIFSPLNKRIEPKETRAHTVQRGPPGAPTTVRVAVSVCGWMWHAACLEGKQL